MILPAFFVFAILAKASLAQPVIEKHEVLPMDVVTENGVVPMGMFEDLISGVLENLRASLPEVISIDNLEMKLPLVGVAEGSSRINNFKAVGLKQFQVKYLKFNILKQTLNIDLLLEDLNINTDYWADLLFLNLIPAYGEGRANINLKNLSLNITAKASIVGLKISEVDVLLGLGSATFDLHGLLDNEEFSILVSSILNTTVAKFVNKESALFSRILGPLIDNVLNGILHPAPKDSSELPKEYLMLMMITNYVNEAINNHLIEV